MSALDDVLPALRCPACGTPLMRCAGGVTCVGGHGFDVARQGYLSLTAGRAGPRGDDAAMVGAREDFLNRGHYRWIAQAVADALPDDLLPDGPIVDLAGGTGYYLARILTGRPERRGLCLDVSVAALRRAARAHERLAAVGADVWSALPVADAAAGAVLSVFGPRNPAQTVRILRAGGVAVTVAPTADHLAEIVGPLGLLHVDERKAQRVDDAFADFTLRSQQILQHRMVLTRQEVASLVAMGPSARHRCANQVAEGLAALPDPLGVTASVRITVHEHRTGAATTR